MALVLSSSHFPGLRNERMTGLLSLSPSLRRMENNGNGTCRARMQDIDVVLEAQLRDSQTGWSVGSFGAIAEFHHTEQEPLLVCEPLARATAQGAIRIDRTKDVTPIAWEALSANPARWQQGVALCLPEAAAASAQRSVLTELGPDAGAILPADRDAILFDMGLGQRNIDFCVRTSDADLIGVLRAAAGTSVLDDHSPAMAAILKAHPHRVAISAIGRCEVFQKIGGPETGGVSPTGPHTHVLPKLMAAGRTHSANTPIPENLVPGMMIHPGSPVMTALGAHRDFDRGLYDSFQALMAQWAPAGYMETKRRVWRALEVGEPPEPEGIAVDRLSRAARRIALRQFAHTSPASAVLADWLAVHDRGPADADPDLHSTS